MNRNLAVLGATIFLNLFMRFTWFPLLPLHLRALGAHEWEVGVSFTLIGIAQTVFAVFGGALADRYGRKMVIVPPTFLMIPQYALAGTTGDWRVVVAMLIGTSALGALQWPALSALIAESSDEDRVARAYSLSEFAVLSGLIAGPIAGAVLLATFNIPALMLLNGLMLGVTATLRGWGLHESRRHTIGSAMPKLRAALDANVRWFIIMGSLTAMAFAITFGPYFAILARDAWRNNEAEINLLFALGNVASLCGILLGRLSDRWGVRRVFMLSALGYGLGAMGWGIAPTWQWGLLPLLIAFSFSEATFIAQQTLQAEITARETRASVMGIITTTTGVIGGLGPTLGAWLITLGGNPLPFLAAGAAALLTMLVVTPIQKVPSMSLE